MYFFRFDYIFSAFFSSSKNPMMVFFLIETDNSKIHTTHIIFVITLLKIIVETCSILIIDTIIDNG